MVTVDRETKDWAKLTLANGDVYDLNGSVAEMRAEAEEIAASLGVTIDAFNWDLPEA